MQGTGIKIKENDERSKLINWTSKAFWKYMLATTLLPREWSIKLSKQK